jgi:hypothetical protein
VKRPQAAVYVREALHAGQLQPSAAWNPFHWQCFSVVTYLVDQAQGDWDSIACRQHSIYAAVRRVVVPPAVALHSAEQPSLSMRQHQHSILHLPASATLYCLHRHHTCGGHHACGGHPTLLYTFCCNRGLSSTTHHGSSKGDHPSRGVDGMQGPCSMQLCHHMQYKQYTDLEAQAVALRRDVLPCRYTRYCGCFRVLWCSRLEQEVVHHLECLW